MQNFHIEANVPVEEHVLERRIGSVAGFFVKVGQELGHKAILAYAKPFDEMHGTNYYQELSEQWAA